MTSRERILTAFRLGTPDRVPVSPFIQPGWLEKAGAWAEPVLEKTDVLLDVGVGGRVEAEVAGPDQSPEASAYSDCVAWGDRRVDVKDLDCMPRVLAAPDDDDGVVALILE